MIRTARLGLRAPRRSDAARLTHLLNDFDVARNLGSLPWPYEKAHAEAFLTEKEFLDPEREAEFALDHPNHGLIGMLGFTDRGHDTVEVGYWLGRPYWGSGFMTEALDSALDWASRSWCRTFIRAWHFADNPASGAVLSKAGFLYTGDTRISRSAARGEDTLSRGMVWLA